MARTSADATVRTATRHGRRRHGFALGIGLPALALLVLVFASLLIGQYPVSGAQLASLLQARLGGAAHQLPAILDTVVFQIRLPRVLAATLVGAALASAGATYQGLFRNPLVSPDILGVSAGAGLGAVLGIFLSLPVLAIQTLAFAFGLGAVFTVYLLSRLVRGHDPVLVLVLAGVVMGSLAGACISLLKYLADPYDQLPAITFWLLGSLSSVTSTDVRTTAPLVILGLVPLYLLRWRVNVMSLGDEEARSLGVHAGRMRVVFITCATLMTAAVVSISGVIGWVGLVIPHIARLLVGPNFSRLLPTSMLLGAGYLLVVDDIARSASHAEIPLGVLTAFIGAPFFLWLLARARRSW